MLSTQYPLVLHADQEHDRLRALITLLIFVGMWMGYRLLYGALHLFADDATQDYAVFLSCIGGVPLGLALVWGIEKLLKRVWHSGNSLTLQDATILAQFRDADALRIDITERMDLLQWCFVLGDYARGGSERRAPKKWYCLALQLQEDENRLILYTFVPPEQALAIAEDGASDFHEIHLKDVYAARQGIMRLPSRPEIPAEVLRGKDGRFWLAERRRWQEGLELTRQDFATLMEFIQTTNH